MKNININKKSTQSGRKERPECSADTKLFFDDVYKSGTREKKQQVDVLQYGRSMIEMLGVLAIVGVLSVGGIAGYSKAMKKFKINKSIDQISHIVANIRTLYAQQTTYEGLNVANAIKMGVTPSEMGTGTTLTNPFNGNSYINVSLVNDKYFTVSYGISDIDTCVALASYDWGDKHSSGLIGVAITSSPEPYVDEASTYCGVQTHGIACNGKISLPNASVACMNVLNDWPTVHFSLVYQ